MLRKGGDAAEFVYGLGISSLEPAEHEQDEDDMPLRFVSVQLELPDTSRSFDIDLHGFLFQADGTYVDCVFYKNPTLAGKSVRLLQEEKQLLVDLRYVPKRCSYIVCTLAIYSGGTVAQLGNGTVRFPDLPAGQLPTSLDSYEWACLGILPLKSRANRGEECGMMLCLLAQHAGFWYFKPVLRAVSAFTPQGLIEPAQDFVTKHLAGMNADSPGVELGMLLKAVREGTQVEMDLTDTESSLGPQDAAQPWDAEGSDGEGWVESHEGDEEARERRAAEERAETGDVHLPRRGEKGVTRNGEAHEGVDGEGEGPFEDYRWHKLSPTEGPAGKDFQAAFVEGDEASPVQFDKFAGHPEERKFKAAMIAKTKRVPLGFKKKEAFGLKARTGEGDFSRLKRPAGMRPHGKDLHEEGYEVESSEPIHGRPSADEYVPATGEEDEHITSSWKDTVEKRLAALEGTVDSMRADIRAIAAAASDMQRNNKLYVQELRNKFTELRGDVAADIESALAGPLRALNMRLDKLEANEAADAKELAEQQKKLWAVDRMVTLAERNSHLIAQSLSELRYQLAGFEQHVVLGAPIHRGSSPLTDQEKGLPVSLRPAAARTVSKPSHEVQSAESPRVPAATPEGGEQGVFASQALSELGKMQYHAEAFGKCLRQLASGTAPDGLKGLNPIERKVLSFAGTPKVFDALHELERAVDAINFHGSNAAGTKLY
ncbi:hypothetical protein Emed_003575 [Eimeria media]